MSDIWLTFREERVKKLFVIALSLFNMCIELYPRIYVLKYYFFNFWLFVVASLSLKILQHLFLLLLLFFFVCH